MPLPATVQDQIEGEARDLYLRALRALTDAGIPFLVGGAYAFARYTGIVRRTKAIDLFVRRRDIDRVIAVLQEAGAGPRRPFPTGSSRPSRPITSSTSFSAPGTASRSLTMRGSSMR